MTQEDALKVFKCLSDASRRRIVQSLTQGEMYTELLAERLELTPSTISFHMKKLEDAGLVASHKEQYYTVYSLNRVPLDKTLAELVTSSPEQIDEQQRREEQYRQKVIKSFFEYDRLRSIPAQRKKRLIVLERLAEEFEPGRDYSEREVNLAIANFHDDFCTLRRDLVDECFMCREDGQYRRVVR